MASAIGSCTSHRRPSHASAAPPPAAPPSNAHLRSPTLERSRRRHDHQPPTPLREQARAASGGVGRDHPCIGGRVRAGRWAAAPCAVVRAGERRRRGRRRCPRRGPSGPRAVRRGTGRGTLDGAREPGQTGDGAATHFTASTKSKFERRHAKEFLRWDRDLLREEAVHRLIGCLRTVWGRHSPTMPLGHRAGRWESPPWRLARQCSFFIHSHPLPHRARASLEG